MVGSILICLKLFITLLYFPGLFDYRPLLLANTLLEPFYNM